MDNKRTVLAVVLSMAVILIYQMFILPKPPEKGPGVQPRIATPTPTPAEAGSSTSALSAAPSVPVAPLVPGSEIEKIIARQQAAGAREIKIDEGPFQVTLNTRGGFASAWRLADYRDASGEALEMVPRETGGQRALGVVFKDDGLTRAFTDGYYLVDEGGEKGLPGDRTVTLTHTDSSGLQLVKIFTFHRASALVETRVELKNLGSTAVETPWWLTWGAGLGREDEEKGRYYHGPLTYIAGKASQDRPKGENERRDVPPGFSWIGITNRYFLAAFIPGPTEVKAFMHHAAANNYTVGIGPSSALIPAGGSAVLEATLFVGPKAYDQLKSYGHHLEEAVDFGFFGFVGKPLMQILKFFHHYTFSWGVAIILLTLLVKLLLFPVTFTMYRSMRRMQALQPQMQALRKKFKDDTQALNQAMMELYREHKVNPLGGCLPMVIQIPVFFALYKVLSIVVELRGASFLHITDLSADETTLGQFIHHHLSVFPAALLPLKILVLLMGATMFIQQRMTPSTADPKQAKVMMVFPFVFTAMFWNFSSGLVVYFLFSNLLSIGEQTIIRKFTHASATPAEEAKGGKGRTKAELS